MIIKPNADAALQRVRRMVELYRDYMVTEGSLLGAVVDAVPTVPVDDLVRLLPEELQPKFRDWVRDLPDVEYKGIIYWPIPDGATIAFKNWLRENPSSP